jgi:ACT domain-containing protein
MNNVAEKIIKPKIGLLELAKQLGSVSKACKVMGYSRDSFYRFKHLILPQFNGHRIMLNYRVS